MAITRLELGSREAWLQARAKRIGGSDAAAIVGLNPYMTNVDLWEQKTGRAVQEEGPGSKFARYGTEAEKYLRQLFILDYPQFEVGYSENNMFLNDDYPFAHASLDGWLTDGEGRKGILEIKTTTIQSPTQKTKWENRIPDNYYCQVYWYMAVCEAEFAILKAQLKWDNGSDIFLVTRHYQMERKDMQSDIDFLMKSGAEFYEYIKKDIRPPLLLPEI